MLQFLHIKLKIFYTARLLIDLKWTLMVRKILMILQIFKQVLFYFYFLRLRFKNFSCYTNVHFLLQEIPASCLAGMLSAWHIWKTIADYIISFHFSLMRTEIWFSKNNLYLLRLSKFIYDMNLDWILMMCKPSFVFVWHWMLKIIISCAKGTTFSHLVYYHLFSWNLITIYFLTRI